MTIPRDRRVRTGSPPVVVMFGTLHVWHSEEEEEVRTDLG